MSGTRIHPARPHIVVVAIVAAVAITAWWAFRPLPSPHWPEPAAAAESAEVPLQLATLDTRPFSTPLWVAPPAPPAAPTPPPPPPLPPPLPPFKLQLIAIVQDPATPINPATSSTSSSPTMSALMYDPDADRLITLKPGDQAAGRTIIAITAGGIQLRERTTTRTLALREDPAPIPGLLQDHSRPASPTAGGGRK